MFVNRGCDGFVVAATCLPGSYADFVRHMVPELQRMAAHAAFARTQRVAERRQRRQCLHGDPEPAGAISRQGRQYQDEAVTLRRPSGEIRAAMTVATAATAILRISAPSPT
jgi:hypothetical protein